MGLLCLLTACGAPIGPQSFRDRAAPIYSNASLDITRLQGNWVQVAGFAPENAPICRPGGVVFSAFAGKQGTEKSAAASATATRQGLSTRLCLSGQEVQFSGRISQTGPGRFSLVGADPAGIGQAWWVLWVDADMRTLVIGTPSGDFGFILNRGRKLPTDRLVAAREILGWNGYDLRRLRLF